jgi:hypothetical protein
MKRMLLLSLALLALTGCSELHAIGNATIRELRADVINVEQNTYAVVEQVREVPVEPRIVMASVYKPQSAKDNKPRRKGLWEKI